MNGKNAFGRFPNTTAVASVACSPMQGLPAGLHVLARAGSIVTVSFECRLAAADTLPFRIELHCYTA